MQEHEPIPREIKRRVERDGLLEDISCEFMMLVVEDPVATRREGRPVHVEKPYASIRQFGYSKTKFVVRAGEAYQFLSDGFNNSGIFSAAQIWPEEYRLFSEATSEDAVLGTRIEEFAGIGRARAADLRAFGVKSVEQLAELTDNAVGKLGHDGESLRERARAWLTESKGLATLDEQADIIREMREEIAKLKAKNVAMATATAEENVQPVDDVEAAARAQFASWDDPALRAYISDKGGRCGPRSKRESLVDEATRLAVEIVKRAA